MKLTLSGEKKLERVHPPVHTGFQNRQQNQKLFDRRLRKGSIGYPPYFGKVVYSMFSVVVVPWDTIMVKKSE